MSKDLKSRFKNNKLPLRRNWTEAMGKRDLCGFFNKEYAMRDLQIRLYKI